MADPVYKLVELVGSSTSTDDAVRNAIALHRDAGRAPDEVR